MHNGLITYVFKVCLGIATIYPSIKYLQKFLKDRFFTWNNNGGRYPELIRRYIISISRYLYFQ
jgi:hypothetical protein